MSDYDFSCRSRQTGEKQPTHPKEPVVSQRCAVFTMHHLQTPPSVAVQNRECVAPPAASLLYSQYTFHRFHQTIMTVAML